MNEPDWDLWKTVCREIEVLWVKGNKKLEEGRRVLHGVRFPDDFHGIHPFSIQAHCIQHFIYSLGQKLSNESDPCARSA